MQASPGAKKSVIKNFNLKELKPRALITKMRTEYQHEIKCSSILAALIAARIEEGEILENGCSYIPAIVQQILNNSDFFLICVMMQ
jgi:hypothetical protein